MEFLLDPSIWAGLLTLIVLEIVLGIDNLIFIAIIADKLPPHQRDKARIIGLVLAMITRLALLSAISWVVTLTTPIFKIGNFGISVRDLILIIGGIFLLFKATMELHERLEGEMEEKTAGQEYAKFGMVIVQIVILDAIFSLDSVITAVGMVDQLPIMIAAVIISMIIMIVSSKSLTKFVNEHPTVVVLCLSFLMMIGLSLVSEGLGFHIPKGYIYAAIGFSLLIEFFNQLARRNFLKNQARRPMRERTAEAIFRLIGQNTQAQANAQQEIIRDYESFAEEERDMITGVLTLASRSLRSLMTPRVDISWIDCQEPTEIIKEQLLKTPHNMFPVCDGELDKVIGVVRAKDLLNALNQEQDIYDFASKSPPIIVPDMIDVINLIPILKKSKGKLAVITNEFDMVQGVISPLDILEAIAGEFPDEDEPSKMIKEGDSWLVQGNTNIHTVMRTINKESMFEYDDQYVSLAGFLLAQKKKISEVGDIIEVDNLSFEVLEVKDYRIERVKITKKQEEM